MHPFHRFNRSLLLAMSLFFAAGEIAVAQEITRADTAAWVLVYTSDGNEFTGQLLSQDAETVVLKTEHFGVLTIRRSAITRIRSTEKAKITNGRVWFENRHAPRYFVGPSAYGLRKGEGVYENSELFFSQVSYGFSDHFSLGVGFAPFFILYDGPFPVWVTPKFSIPVIPNKFNVALGGFIGHEFNTYYFDSDNPDGSLNAAFCTFTYGSRDANVSASFGLNFSGSQWNKRAIFSLAGTVRLAPKFALLGESYFFDDYGDPVSLYGAGARFMGRRIAFDAGVAVMAYGFDDAYPVPYATLHVPFGSVKN